MAFSPTTRTYAVLAWLLPAAGAACVPSGPRATSAPAAPAAPAHGVAGEQVAAAMPRTIVLRGELLAESKLRIGARDTALLPAYEKLLDDARKALAQPLVAVTDKSTLLPPSGSRNDYFSLSPYWWPDTTKPDGLPYIRRDGVTNPESKRDLDQPRVARLGSTLQTLGLAYYLSGDERYAERAAAQVRHWFLNPATRMTPHLRFAQLVRGLNRERGSGIIDTRWFIEVVDAVRLIEGSNAWTAADDAALREWFRQYLEWLVKSPNGIDESDAPNNHGSWYAAQVAAYALFVGDSATARHWLQTIPARVDSQFTAEGTQPREGARTRALHYHAFNIEALSRLAEMGRHVGIDLWHHVPADGAGIRRGLEYVAPFIVEPERWPGNQINDVEQAELAVHLRRGAAIYGDPRYLQLFERLPAEIRRTDRSVLLYPN